MQDAFSSLETYNRCPHCLRIELTSAPIPSDSSGGRRVVLNLTLEFNEQWQSVLKGRVKLGLRGGKLHLHLNRSTSLVEGFDGLGLVFFPEIPSLCVAARSPSEQEFVWVLRSSWGEPCLKGAIANVKFVMLELTETPDPLTVLFSVNPVDLYLTETEGLWKHDIHPNQHAVFDRKLALTLWQSQFKPYLSVARWPAVEAHALEREGEQDFSALQPVIDRLSSAKTQNFFELAAIAELDPMQDFAGGNLLGTTLTRLDLSGANLTRANLRGADLSDADLSETDLSNTNLRGADLSGAYLGNADLHNADLYRASLALANLGGANLRGANLQEANLSKANLGSINVEGATFGQNTGLTEDVRRSLEQRGAIFPER